MGAKTRGAHGGRHSSGSESRFSDVNFTSAALLGTKILAALLSAAVVIGTGWAWATYRSFEGNVRHIDVIGPRPTSTSSTGPKVPTGPGVAENILLVGDDERPTNMTAAEARDLGTQQDGGSDDTDTMMVLHIPADGARGTVISFPRDSWVEIPGFGHDKLNAAFVDGSLNGGGDAGGAKLLIKVIQNMTGLTIDHFVRVSLTGFYEIAQAIGPVRVCLNEHAFDPYSGTNLPKGVSELNARQALSFVRQRHNLPRGDLDREVRQQYFLSQALNKVLTAGTLLDPLKLEHLLTAVSSSLETDAGLNLLEFADEFQNLTAGNVTYATIPVSNPNASVDANGQELSIVALDFAAIPGFIAKVVGPTAAYTAAQPAPASTVDAVIINATGEGGQATASSQTLDAIGFHTTIGDDASPTSLTTISYPAGMEAQAKALVADVPGAAVVETSAVTAVTLTLGTDGHHAVNPAAPKSAPSSATGSSSSSASDTPRTYTASDCIN